MCLDYMHRSFSGSGVAVLRMFNLLGELDQNICFPRFTDTRIREPQSSSHFQKPVLCSTSAVTLVPGLRSNLTTSCKLWGASDSEYRMLWILTKERQENAIQFHISYSLSNRLFFSTMVSQKPLQRKLRWPTEQMCFLGSHGTTLCLLYEVRYAKLSVKWVSHFLPAVVNTLFLHYHINTFHFLISSSSNLKGVNGI